MSFKASDHIQTILKNLPMKPGVYLMKDRYDTIIYVGKAKRLRNRVRSYFNSSAENNLKTLHLRENIVDESTRLIAQVLRKAAGPWTADYVRLRLLARARSAS